MDRDSEKPTLIIPAAGRSSRYPGKKPKWLLTHPHGRLMIEEVLSTFDFEDFRRIIIIALEEHCKDFDVEIILNQALGDLVEIFVLDKSTNSSPETVYTCIKGLDLDGPIVIKDSDCLVEYSIPKEENYVVSIDIHDQHIPNLTAKSFLLSDENNLIKQIIEKRVVSDQVCLGVYSGNSEDFCSAYEDLSQLTGDMGGELYFSHLISHLINEGHVFASVEASRFIDWGTVQEWNEYTSSLRTYIFDIDGVFLENSGKYGTRNWGNSCVPIEENISRLKQLSNENAEIIFITSRTEEYLSDFRDLLKKEEITFKQIVSGCNHNRRIIVNDFAPSNPYPSCESVNLPRNGKLGDYI